MSHSRPSPTKVSCVRSLARACGRSRAAPVALKAHVLGLVPFAVDRPRLISGCLPVYALKPAGSSDARLRRLARATRGGGSWLERPPRRRPAARATAAAAAGSSDAPWRGPARHRLDRCAVAAAGSSDRCGGRLKICDRCGGGRSSDARWRLLDRHSVAAVPMWRLCGGCVLAVSPTRLCVPAACRLLGSRRPPHSV